MTSNLFVLLFSNYFEKDTLHSSFNSCINVNLHVERTFDINLHLSGVLSLYISSYIENETFHIVTCLSVGISV